MLQMCYQNLGKERTADAIRDKFSLVASNISIDEIQEFLLNLYNKSPFYRKLFVFGYRVLKKLNKK
jgi:hypothetical protein